MKLETKEGSCPQREGLSLQVRQMEKFPFCVSKVVAKETIIASMRLWDGLVDIYAIFLLL